MRWHPGALPPGLSLANNGAITGKATDTGSFNFSVLITDSLGAHQTLPYAMNVIIGTDPYGGFTAAPLPGCASSGYFQLKQVGNNCCMFCLPAVQRVLPSGGTCPQPTENWIEAR